MTTMRRRLTLNLVVGCLVTVLIMASASPVSAAVVETRFQNVGTGQCLDGYAARGPYITDCNSGRYQVWIWNNTVSRTPIRHKATLQCLAGDAEGFLSLISCDSSDYFLAWRVNFPPAGGPPFIKHAVHLYCLAHDGYERVSAVACSSGVAIQRWNVIR